MFNFRKALLLLFKLFLISVTSAQEIDRSYLNANYFFNQELDVNPFLLGHCSNVQNVAITSSLKLDSIQTFSVTGSQSKWFYDFDENGILNSKMTKSYTNSTWENWLYFNYSYDSNDNLISTLTKYWMMEHWENDMLETYTYGEDGNVSEHITQFWINDEWVNKNKVSYFYDSNKYLEILLYEDWIDTLWVNNYRLLFSNPIDGKPESLIFEDWNGEQWDKLTQGVFMYNDNNKLANTVVGKWDGTSWQYYLQAIFEYDLNGNMIKELHQLWDENNWQDEEQYFFEYNSDNYFTYGRSEMWNGAKWEQFDGMFSFTNPDGFTEHLWTFEAEAYYSVKTNVEEENDLELNNFELSQNYPNPFNPSTTIKYEIPDQVRNDIIHVQLKVYDVLGREIATLVNKEQKAGNYQVQFDASNLGSGVYFYRLRAGTFSQSRKMIVLK